MEQRSELLLPLALKEWLLLNGRKLSTANNHAFILRSLINKNINLTEHTAITAFLAGLVGKVSTSNINNYVSTLRIYYAFCQENGRSCDPLLKSLKFVKDRYRQKATLSDEEIESILSLPPATKRYYNVVTKKIEETTANPKSYEYWTVFFNILAFSGMRPGEVAALKVENVDFGRGVFVLEDTKINEPRFVPIAANITEILRSWVKDKEGYIFPSKRPEGHTSSVEWQYNFTKRIKRLGIVRPNLTPYSLRHSLITRLLEEDVNIFKVQKIVGHHDLRTTSIYTHLTTKDIQKAINKHPLIMKHTDPKNVLDSIEGYLDGLGLDSRFDLKKTRIASSLSFKVTVRARDHSETLQDKHL